jgi:small subunit ribosomal protein S16
MGRKNLPAYRIAAFDSRTRRDGPPLEILGWFNPLSREAGKGFKVKVDRVEDWVRRGARLTLAVSQLLRRQGVALAAAAAKPAAPKADRKKPAKKRAAKPDPKAVERRKRKIAKRAGRRALREKRAAAAKAAAAGKKA